MPTDIQVGSDGSARYVARPEVTFYAGQGSTDIGPTLDDTARELRERITAVFQDLAEAFLVAPLRLSETVPSEEARVFFERPLGITYDVDPPASIDYETPTRLTLWDHLLLEGDL